MSTKKGFVGCRHSSVDSSALSILPPQVRLPSPPSTLLSFTVKFVLYFSLQCEKRTKINKKEGGFGRYFKKVGFWIRCFFSNLTKRERLNCIREILIQNIFYQWPDKLASLFLNDFFFHSHNDLAFCLVV